MGYSSIMKVLTIFVHIILTLLVSYKYDNVYFATPSLGNVYIRLTLPVGDKDGNAYFATALVGTDYINLTLPVSYKDYIGCFTTGLGGINNCFSGTCKALFIVPSNNMS